MIATRLKLLLFSVSLFISFPSFSQGKPDKETLEHATATTKWMTPALRLDSAQVRKIQAINIDIDMKFKDARNKLDLNSKEFKKEMRKLDTEREDRYSEVLSSNQMIQYEKEKPKHGA